MDPMTGCNTPHSLTKAHKTSAYWKVFKVMLCPEREDGHIFMVIYYKCKRWGVIQLYNFPFP